MRILMVSQFYHPVIGGIESVVRDLSGELARRGHEVSVVTQAHPDAPSGRDGDVRIHRISTSVGRVGRLFRDPERHHLPPAPDPEAVRGLRRVLDEIRPDIVHAHDWLACSLFPPRHRSDARLVLSLHDYSALCATKRLMHAGAPCSGPGALKCMRCAAAQYGPLKGSGTALAMPPMRRFLLERFDLLLPVSRAAAEGNRLAERALAFEVIPNFVARERAPAADPAVAGLSAALPPDPYMLFAGDLTPEKGADVLFEAYTRLSDAPPLVLIGRRPAGVGPLPPGVVHLGSWPRQAVFEAWRRCAFGVVPSQWHEPFGLVALEAMASGRPVIVAAAGALKELVIDGRTGLHVEPGDAEGLARAMQRLLGDTALRAELGRGALAHAADYQADRVVERFEAAYDRVLARPGTPRR